MGEEIFQRGSKYYRQSLKHSFRGERIFRGSKYYVTDHAWEAREILWVVHVHHVILAHVGYNWHVAVDLGYIASTQISCALYISHF